MRDLPEIAPPVFESDEQFQGWLEGRIKNTAVVGLNSPDEEPPPVDSDEEYERYLRGNQPGLG